MVAAGVYLLVKLSFLLALVPIAGYVIACIGIVTSLMAALMATQQNDIKRILAYSTLSQLGYMICAVGAGASMAAMFHLFTHAYFKALLFLGRGRGDPRDAPRAGHLEDGRTAAADAGHVLDVPRRHPRADGLSPDSRASSARTR